MFEQENAFFNANRDMLREKYPGKELVLVGNEIVGVFDDVGTAVRETAKVRKLGTFAVKEVDEDPEPCFIPFYSYTN